MVGLKQVETFVKNFNGTKEAGNFDKNVFILFALLRPTLNIFVILFTSGGITGNF